MLADIYGPFISFIQLGHFHWRWHTLSSNRTNKKANAIACEWKKKKAEIICFRSALIQGLQMMSSESRFSPILMSVLIDTLNSPAQFMAIWLSTAPELYFTKFNLIQKCVLSPSRPRKSLIAFYWLWFVHTPIPEPNMQARKKRTFLPDTQDKGGIHSIQNTWSKNRGSDSFPDGNQITRQLWAAKIIVVPCTFLVSVESVGDLITWLHN